MIEALSETSSSPERRAQDSRWEASFSVSQVAVLRVWGYSGTAWLVVKELLG